MTDTESEVKVQEKSIFNILGEAYRDANNTLQTRFASHIDIPSDALPRTLRALMKVPQGFDKLEVLDAAFAEIGDHPTAIAAEDDIPLAFIIDSAMEFIMQRMQQDHARKLQLEHNLRQGAGGAGLITR